MRAGSGSGIGQAIMRHAGCRISIGVDYQYSTVYKYNCLSKSDVGEVGPTVAFVKRGA